jgi:hypothetical protein
MTSNEIRQIVGMKPSDDPKADELRNKNLSQPKDDQTDPSNDATEEKIEMVNNEIKEEKSK